MLRARAKGKAFPFDNATCMTLLDALDELERDRDQYAAALAAIRDHTPHTEYANTSTAWLEAIASCPACIAAVALNPEQPYGFEASTAEEER